MPNVLESARRAPTTWFLRVSTWQFLLFLFERFRRPRPTVSGTNRQKGLLHGVQQTSDMPIPVRLGRIFATVSVERVLLLYRRHPASDSRHELGPTWKVPSICRPMSISCGRCNVFRMRRLQLRLPRSRWQDHHCLQQTFTCTPSNSVWSCSLAGNFLVASRHRDMYFTSQYLSPGSCFPFISTRSPE